MSAAMLGPLFAEAGLPPGVVNIVHGLGGEVGEALVRHPSVPLISFTGGTATGQRILASSAPLIKKLSLELGGKNATLVFADADFEKAMGTIVRSAFLNQGEICLCGSRIIVEKSLYVKFVDEFVKRTRILKVGDPLVEDSFIGALISEEHLRKVQGYVTLAEKEGGRIACGREPLNLPSELNPGYFMRPTVITDLPATSRLLREEIFGPVVTIMPFDDEAAAIANNNSVEYGLSASIWTQNLNRAHRVAHALDVGTVWINTWMQRDLRMPFGGMKKSGLGREGGWDSFDFYTEKKTVCLAFGG
jgi:aminomuconate-semialdehyde/2-hydroxymuconate-6-semialdehyde dehydrogenase